MGVERKALTDFINSHYSGRFAGHQLRGLLLCYQVVYVVIEGIWRVDIQSGLILVPKKMGKKTQWVDLEVAGKPFLYRDLEQILFTLEMKGGVMFRTTSNKPQTCRLINALYHWWNDKAWEDHRSHLRFKTLEADKTLLVKPSLCRQVAAVLPGVGWVKSGEIADHFKTVQAMVMAEEGEWLKVPGIGKVMAKNIRQVLCGTT